MDAKLTNPLTGRKVKVTYQRTREIFAGMNELDVPLAWRQARLEYIGKGFSVPLRSERGDEMDVVKTKEVDQAAGKTLNRPTELNKYYLSQQPDLKVYTRDTGLNKWGYPTSIEYYIEGTEAACQAYIAKEYLEYCPSGYSTTFREKGRSAELGLVSFRGWRACSCD